LRGSLEVWRLQLRILMFYV